MEFPLGSFVCTKTAWVAPTWLARAAQAGPLSTAATATAATLVSRVDARTACLLMNRAAHALPCVDNVNMLNAPEGFHILKPAGKDHE
jgi:hypothetical protein